MSHDDPTAPQVLDVVPGTLRLIAIWEGGSASYVLGPGATITAGRSADCSLRIDHASVSRVHARFVGGAEPTVEDLGSSNGVQVSGTRIPPNVRRPIRHGESVELGSVIVLAQGPPAAARRPDAGDGSELDRLVDLVAKSTLPVVILGETGAGKSLTAQRIHELSSRAKRPFVTLNCAAIPEGLLEAELFGYERGAFTGATSPKPGFLEIADGGTLLLDEIAEMSATTQAKILTAIETGVVRRLGSVGTRTVDVRYIAATHQPIEDLVASGRFRSDLFYRLNGLTIRVLPLRDRPLELRALLVEFLAAAATRAVRPTPTIPPETMNRLLSHPWPGNVRELKTAAERAIVLCGSEPLRAEHFGLLPGEATTTNLDAAVAVYERERIEAALAQCNGNQTRAAEVLGLSRRALIGRLENLGIARPRKRP